MTLQDWLENKWLKQHVSSANEVATLLEKVDRDIAEAAKDISLDWRLTIAYNACLGCAAIALRVSGFRVPEGDGHHFRTIDSLKLTIGPPADFVTHLQAIRKRRSIVTYDAAGTTSETEVEEALELAKDLRKLLIDWLSENHPQYLGQ